MNEPEKRGPGRPPKNKEVEADRRDIEEILADLESNATVKVHRTDPEWASGYCGQFYIAQGRGLTTEEIKNRFGGRVLQITIHGPNGKYVKRQTIVIDDIPRREGQPIQRDGTVIDLNNKAAAAAPKSGHPLEHILSLGLPPHLTKQISNYYLGGDTYGGDENRHQNNGGFQDMFGAVQMQKALMDMMNQSNTAQMNMMQSQFEMQKSIMNARRDFEESAKPKDPLGDVNNIIRVVRELNGIKSELGGAPESMTGQILENTMPMVETLLTEYMAYMKMKAQAEFSRPVAVAPSPPALPQRPAAAPVGPVAPIVAAAPSTVEKPNVASMAAQMAQMYVGLSNEEKQEVNMAFISAMNEAESQTYEPAAEPETIDNKVDPKENYDNMEYTPIDSKYLDPTDLELLHNGGADNDKDAAGDVQNSEHTGAIEENDPPYRESDS